ncbi:MAG: sulfatase [Bryobacterales bacterium]
MKAALIFSVALLISISPLARAQPQETNGQQAPEQRPPNIVIILADDLGYGDLGVYGNHEIQTPRLNRMAAEGVRLTEFYSVSPTCTPARAALLTGRYPRRSGMTRVIVAKEKWGLPASEILLAEVLQKQGYATTCIGKWHLGGRQPYRPRRHGFDSYFGVLYSNDMSLLPWVKWPRLELWRDDKSVESPARVETLTRRYTEEAVAFIERNRERPFFLYLPHTMPHTPVKPSARFQGKSAHGPYGDVVEEIDWRTGEILDALRANRIEDNTLVIFTSDNGPWVAGSNKRRIKGGSAGPLRGAKNTTWEGGVRVPFLARWPGRLPAGTVQTGIASLMDLFTTAVELAGAGVPNDRVIDGRNILPLLEGKQGSPHDTLYYYFEQSVFAVRSGDWKLHFQKRELKPNDRPRSPQRCEPPELYNLAADLAEQNNVAANHADIVTRLTGMAREFDAAVDPAMKLPSPSWSVFTGLLTQAPKDPHEVPR